MICVNEKDGNGRNDQYGRAGYTALCPNCTDFIGREGREKKAVFNGEDNAMAYTF